jgi:hypothetical protein
VDLEVEKLAVECPSVDLEAGRRRSQLSKVGFGGSLNSRRAFGWLIERLIKNSIYFKGKYI